MPEAANPMMNTNGAFLARITVYPLKSGDGVDANEAHVLPGGGLEHDRQFPFVDAEGRFVNGKRTPAIHRLRTLVDLQARTFRLATGSDEHVFSIDAESPRISEYLSKFFGRPVTLVENVTTGFPDDLDSPGPTVISTATLETVAGWFPGLTVETVRRRFRANLEIGGVAPFWEDGLYGQAGERVRLRIGDVELLGNNPCQRCGVPPRDPLTGEPWPDFVATFRQRREATLPAFVERSRFDDFYRLAVNTVPASESSGLLRVGDPLECGGTTPLWYSSKRVE